MRTRFDPGVRAWAIFAVGSLGFVLSMFYRVSPSVIAPQLTTDLHLNPATLSELSALFFYAFAACQIPLGLVLDRVGIRWTMGLLSLLGTAGAVVFAWAPDAGWAMWARVMLGVGMSSGLMGPLALFAVWFPPARFATISGLLMAIGALGQMLAATPLALMTQALGWRGAYLCFAGVNLLQAVALLLIVRDRPPGVARPRHEFSPLRGLGRLLSLPAYWGISLATFFRFGGHMALQALWAGPFIIYGLGYSAVQAGNALFLLSLGYMFSLPLAGRLSDRWLASRKKVIVPSLYGFAVLVASLLVWPRGVPLGWVYAAFFLVGVLNGPGQVMYAHIRELVPPTLTATAMTGINLFTMLGPAAVMQVTGWLMAGETSALADPAAFHSAWWFMAATLLLSAVVYSLLPDTRPGRAGGEVRR